MSLMNMIRRSLENPSHVFLLVADVKQDMLETIVPKSEYDSVMVVLGEHRRQVSRTSSGPPRAAVNTSNSH